MAEPSAASTQEFETYAATQNVFGEMKKKFDALRTDSDANTAAIAGIGTTANLASTTPAPLGTADKGNGTTAARSNHVHAPAYQGWQYGGDSAASTTVAEEVIAYVANASKITALKIVPTGAVTSSDTDYGTITIKVRDGAGGAAATLATATTKTSGGGGTGDWAAFTTVDMGTVTNGTLTAGSVITFTLAKSGSSKVQLPEFVIVPIFG